MRRALAALCGVAFLATAISLTQAQAAPDPNTCTGYPEPRIFLESQGWWVTSGNDGITEGNDAGRNFGHIHIGACFPLFQRVSGVVGFDLRILMHDNPGRVTFVRPFICNNQQSDCYRAPDVVFSPALTCAVASCTFYQHVDIDTTRWHYDGLNGVRFRPEVLEPDGNTLRAANNWLMDIQNGNPPRTFVGGPTYIDAKGWYHGNYSSVKISDGYTPNPHAQFAVTYRCGSTNEAVQDCLVTVDPDFHATPPSFGTVQSDNTLTKFQRVVVSPSDFASGSHALVFRTCVHDTRSVPGQDAHRCGVLKLPFTTP